MPTGYTAGILDGDIKTFKEFGMLCARNSGALAHMRDESLSKKYEKRTPSNYNFEDNERDNERLTELENSSNEELIEVENNRTNESIEYHKREILKNQEKRIKLEEFLKKAEEYTPPTEGHKGIKIFMVDQLKITIESDCGDTYLYRAIKELNKYLIELNVDDLRHETKKSIKDDINRHHEKYLKEVEECKKANQWMQDLENSL